MDEIVDNTISTIELHRSISDNMLESTNKNTCGNYHPIIHRFKKYDSIFKKSGFTEIYKQNVFHEGGHKLKGCINTFIKIRWILFNTTKMLYFPYSGNGLLIIFEKMRL